MLNDQLELANSHGWFNGSLYVLLIGWEWETNNMCCSWKESDPKTEREFEETYMFGTLQSRTLNHQFISVHISTYTYNINKS